MTAITRDSVLADILEQHCELIPIANRFGIFFWESGTKPLTKFVLKMD